MGLKRIENKLFNDQNHLQKLMLHLDIQKLKMEFWNNNYLIRQLISFHKIQSNLRSFEIIL